jgi:hypothetical protein
MRLVANEKQPASHSTCGPFGELFGIDQEVVTLRGLYGNSGSYYGSPGATSRRDQIQNSPVSVRTVAAGRDRPAAPLRATRSKSQPPHLVLDSHYSYYNQNLSFDHLLSGVSPH